MSLLKHVLFLLATLCTLGVIVGILGATGVLDNQLPHSNSLNPSKIPRHLKPHFPVHNGNPKTPLHQRNQAETPEPGSENIPIDTQAAATHETLTENLKEENQENPNFLPAPEKVEKAEFSSAEDAIQWLKNEVREEVNETHEENTK